MSTSIPPPVRGKGWVFQVTALSIVLGMLLALALRTQRHSAEAGNVPIRLPALRAEFINMRQQNVKLQKDLAEYKDRYEQLAKDQAAGTHNAEAFERALGEAKMLAGTVAVRGPGVVVTLRDSPNGDPASMSEEVMMQYLVHDSDIRTVVNELNSAGAEAISVNGQRLMASSSIRCAGPVVLVNRVSIAPPYRIRAIGKPDVMQTALELPGGPVDWLFLSKMIEVVRQPDMVVPAFTGSTRFNSAKPVKGTR